MAKYNCNVLSVVSNSNNSHNSRAWVDTVTDLNQYKPSQEELDQRKVSRKSNNKLLAKVSGCGCDLCLDNILIVRLHWLIGDWPH